MASSTAYFLLLSLPFLAAAQSQPPAPVGVNPVTILTSDGRFTTLLGLVTQASLVPSLLAQLNSSNGVTIFAPTNNAFMKIAAILPTLSDANRTTILTYHVVPKYISFGDLNKTGDPVGTLAAGLTLSFNGGNVSTGVVNTRLGTPVYDAFPLAIFPVEDVLIPPRFATGVAAPGPGSAASSARVGWGGLVGAVLAFMSFF